MKICNKCKVKKEDAEFGIDKRNNSLRSWCRECVRINSTRNYYEKMKPLLHPYKPKRPVKEGHKWCLKCGGEKPISDFYRRGGNTCKSCANKKARERQKINRADVTKKQKEYRKRIGREVLNERQQAWRAKNKERSAAWARNTRRRLTDSYITQNILKPKGVPITKQNIEIARTSLLLKKIKKAVEKTGFKICDGCKKKKDVSEFGNCSFWWKGVKKYRKNNLCKKCYSRRYKKYRSNDNAGGFGINEGYKNIGQ